MMQSQSLKSRIFYQGKLDIKNIKSLFKEKKILFGLVLFINFAYVISLTILNQGIFERLNTIVMAFVFFVDLLFCWKRKSIRLDVASMFLVIDAIITIIIGLILKNYSLITFLNILVLLCTYQTFAACDRSEKELMFRVIYFAFIFYMFYLLAIGLLPWLRGNGHDALSNELTYNLDTTANLASFVFVMSLFYARRFSFIDVIFALLSLLVVIISERRGAFIMIGISLIGFLYSAVQKHSRFIVLCITFIIIASIIYFSIPTLNSTLLKIFGAFDSVGTIDGIIYGEQRLGLLVRTFLYSFSNFFGALGYWGAVDVLGSLNAHDLIGDLTLQYGALIGLINLAFFTIAIVTMVKKKTPFHNLMIMFALLYFVSMFTTSFFTHRHFSYLAGALVGLTIFPKQVETSKVRRYKVFC